MLRLMNNFVHGVNKHEHSSKMILNVEDDIHRVVQYTRTESHRLRYAPTRLAGSPMAKNLENKRIIRVMSLQSVGKVGGSSRSDTDGHDPSLRIPT